MQDNSKYDLPIDGSFLDESWEKMQLLLDEELPVGTPLPTKRNYGYRLALSLLLLSFFSASVWLWQSNIHEETTPVENALVIDQPLATTLLPVIKERERTSPIAIIHSNNAANNVVSDNSSSEKSNLNNTISNLSATRTDAASSASPLIVTASNTLTNKIGNIDNIAPEDVNSKVRESMEMPTRDLKTSSQMSSSAANDKSPITLKLITNKLVLPSETHPVFKKEDASIRQYFVTPVMAPKWQIGLMAGIQLEKLRDGFGGFSGGILLSRRLGKNFGIESGLSYSLSQFNKTILNNTPGQLSINQTQPNGLPGTPSNVTREPFSFERAEDTEPLQLGKASWLSVPILLTYQPARQIKVNMGLEFARLLNAKEQKIFDAKTKFPKEVERFIANNNVAALFGVCWFPDKHLGLDFRYNFGFTDLSKNSQQYIEQTDTRSSLQCSLVYYFGSSL